MKYIVLNSKKYTGSNDKTVHRSSFIVHCFIFCLSILFVSPLCSQTKYEVKTVPNDHLKNASDYVTNPDEIISQSTEQQLNTIIASIEETASAEVAIVLLSSIGQEDIDLFATDLFTDWGIGKKNDNGLLFLLVYDQRQMVFRTGYGLEGVLPDVILSRIIRDDISPLLRNGDFDGGIVAGISKVGDFLRDPESVREILQQEKAAQSDSSKKRIYFYLFFTVVVFGCFLFYFFKQLNVKTSNYRKYLSLSKSKAFVIVCAVIFPILMVLFLIIYLIMMNKLRKKPVDCSVCGHKMHRLNESEDNNYLTKAQDIEEKVRSVDYDVWLCSNCGNNEILAYDKYSRYTVCPYCRAKTYYLANDSIIRQATTFQSGSGQKTYTCVNCGKTDLKSYTIPMIVLTSSSGRRGSSFGGGGGSWGGGRTGGGGARGGW
jgi:uncharacterized protein